MQNGRIWIDSGRIDLKYWVIDLLDLNNSEKSRDPLVYSFDSEYFYFPLVVSLTKH